MSSDLATLCRLDEVAAAELNLCFVTKGVVEMHFSFDDNYRCVTS